MNRNHELELDELCDIVAQEGVVRYLEIGSRNGISLAKIGQAVLHTATSLNRGDDALAVAVDLPGGLWGQPGTEEKLNGVAQALRGVGLPTQVVIGDSGAPDIIDRIRALGPFDLVYIDADHRYEPVKRDWNVYDGRIVALDDVLYRDDEAEDPPGVWRLWEELQPRFRTRLIAAASSTQGIGVVYRK